MWTENFVLWNAFKWKLECILAIFLSTFADVWKRRILVETFYAQSITIRCDAIQMQRDLCGRMLRNSLWKLDINSPTKALVNIGNMWRHSDCSFLLISPLKKKFDFSTKSWNINGCAVSRLYVNSTTTTSCVTHSMLIGIETYSEVKLW